VSTVLSDDLRRDRATAVTLFAADADALARPYGAGKWSARRVLVHLADAVGVQYDRLRRLQADDKPLLWAFDPDRWAEHLRYDQRDLRLAQALFTANYDAIIEIASLTPSERYERAGVHSESGRKTFAEVLTFVHWHTRHHLDQVEAAVAGATWTPPG
jgi:hypothetical protein